jgi:hypothetical protein
MAVASVAFGAAGLIAGNFAAADQAKDQVKENERQQKRIGEIASEKKSDRARQADQALGSMFAAHADTGAGLSTIGRAAGAIGAVEGLDIGRIESNRAAQATAKHAESVSIVKGTRSQILGNTLKFFSKTAGTAAGAMGGPATAAPTSGGVTKTSFEMQKGDF